MEAQEGGCRQIASGGGTNGQRKNGCSERSGRNGGVHPEGRVVLKAARALHESQLVRTLACAWETRLTCTISLLNHSNKCKEFGMVFGARRPHRSDLASRCCWWRIFAKQASPSTRCPWIVTVCLENSKFESSLDAVHGVSRTRRSMDSTRSAKQGIGSPHGSYRALREFRD